VWGSGPAPGSGLARRDAGGICVACGRPNQSRGVVDWGPNSSLMSGPRGQIGGGGGRDGGLTMGRMARVNG
jgi:hypothetical protein